MSAQNPEEEMLQETAEKKVSTPKRAQSKKKSAAAEFWEWVKYLGIGIGAALLIRMFFFEFVFVDGQSMMPTLENRSYLIMEKVSYWFNEPEYGDIIICSYPYVNGDYVKRVVGKPGDVLYAENGVLYRNGQALDEPYIAEAIRDNFGPEEVPEDAYYVLGDNRNESLDSRIVGPIEEERIIGKAAFVVFPIEDMGVIEH